MCMLKWHAFFFLFINLKMSANSLKRGDRCADGVSVCATVSECPIIVSQIRKGIRPKICGFESSKVVLCCPHLKSTQPTTPKPDHSAVVFPGNKKISVAAKYCGRYNQGICSVRPPSISGSISRAVIVGGVPSHPKQFPHMALIGYGSTFSHVQWLCGGSLISEFYVLSAAHCVRSSLGDAGWVRLGELDLSSTGDDADPQDFVITDRIIHPDYHSPSSYNDIALFKLNRAARLNNYVRPICLHENQDIPRKELIASGWGTTGYGEATSSILLHVNLTQIDYDTCDKLVPPSSFLSKGVDRSSQICAGYLNGGKDTCLGDSGGPLQYLSSRPGCSNIYHQVGIVSFGKGCALKNSPGIYTNVAHYIRWIESIVWN